MAIAPYTVEPLARRRDYRHMAKRDAEVWERFLDLEGARFTGVSYDVALGGVTLPEAAGTPAERAGWQYNTALRVDAILWRADGALIAEVRPSATVSAFGAALGYALVAQREGLTDLPITPGVICEMIQPDVRWLCQQLGVLVFEV